MVLADAFAHLYLIADRNAVPLLAKFTLLPDIVPPHLSLEVRLDVATHVRVLVQCGNGTALQVKRWVWVMPSFMSAGSVHQEAKMSDRIGRFTRPPVDARQIRAYILRVSGAPHRLEQHGAPLLGPQ